MPDVSTVTFERFDALMRDIPRSKRLPLDMDSKYVIVSDLHLGNGSAADNFVHNEVTVWLAFEYYRDQGYSVIMAGDVEELWQFELDEIRDRYNGSIYPLLRSFGPDRVHRVYGNHDRVWGGMSDPLSGDAGLFRWATEAVRLDDKVLITHGHQGEMFCDRGTWIGRFFARGYRYVERIARLFGDGDTSDTMTEIPKGRERTYYQWAKSRQKVLICGHTHRALFASKPRIETVKERIEELSAGEQTAETARELAALKHECEHESEKGRDIEALEDHAVPIPCYFNSGCGGYKTGFTAIEIEGNAIRLVKWRNDETLPDDERRHAYVEEDLYDYMDAIASAAPPQNED